MLPDRVSNPGPLTYESGALPIALRGPASTMDTYEKARLNFTRIRASFPLRREVLLFVSFLATRKMYFFYKNSKL